MNFIISDTVSLNLYVGNAFHKLVKAIDASDQMKI